jgi:hypothetical protein
LALTNIRRFSNMSEEDLELLITTDDPGEDTLEEDTFHLPADKTTTKRKEGETSK